MTTSAYTISISEIPPQARTLSPAAGFDDIVVQESTEAVSNGSLDAIAPVLLRVGPLGRILRENPGLKTEAESRLRAALAEDEKHGMVALQAATWIVTARPVCEDRLRVEISD